MKAKCNICGYVAKMDKEYTETGITLRKSIEMEEHEKQHKEEVEWELVEEEKQSLKLMKDWLEHRLALAESELQRRSIETDLRNIKKLIEFDGYIDVFDCQAVLRVNYNGLEITDDILKEIINEKEKKKLDKLIMKAVEEQGAINWSGIYGLTKELNDYARFLIEKYKDEISKIKNSLRPFRTL